MASATSPFQSVSGLQYRVKSLPVQIGKVLLWMLCLEDLNRTIDEIFAELEKTGRASLLDELCPYFGTLWPSARALAEAIAEQPAPYRHCHVLELGCGLALPSLVAARLGAYAYVSDFHPDVPEFLRRNLELNELTGVEYGPIAWKDDCDSSATPPARRFERIIASDVLYEKEHPPKLAATVAHYLAPGGVALIADPGRPYLQAFVDDMKRRGFECETRIKRVDDVPAAREIFLLELRIGQT